MVGGKDHEMVEMLVFLKAVEMAGSLEIEWAVQLAVMTELATAEKMDASWVVLKAAKLAFGSVDALAVL